MSEHGFPRWLALSAAALAVLTAGTAAAARSASASHAVKATRSGVPSALAVALLAPSAGDVSYGVAQVAIARGARLLATPPGRGQIIFTGRIGGVTITARSPQWRSLRATTRVYVVVSRVAGGDATVRDIAFFIVRSRSGPSGARRAGGEVVFSAANAQPAVGSFWVRGVDRRGYANVFEVRDILATALANWSRYLGALTLRHALGAAMHPLEVTAQLDRARNVPLRGRAGGPWTGGQPPTRRVRAMFRLLVGALGSPISYAAMKKSPLVVDFIAHELRNPVLALRWRNVTTKLPLEVPDRYAAAAQEEARFTSVSAPRISPRGVLIEDGANSSDEAIAAIERNAPLLTVSLSGDGTVTGRTYVYGQNIDCVSPHPPLAPGQHGSTPDPCAASFTTGAAWETLGAVAAPGFLFAGWHGCDQVTSSGDCRVLMGDASRTVSADFNQPATLYITNPGNGIGEVFARDCGPFGETISGCSVPWGCPLFPGQTCSHQLSSGDSVDLRAEPDPGDGVIWGGCDTTSGRDCSVTIAPNGTRITALFHQPFHITVTVQSANGGSGRVTSSPSGIDCGPMCAAVFSGVSSVALTATPDVGSDIRRWLGCDSVSGSTCTVSATVSNAAVSVEFERPPVIARFAGDGSRCAAPPNCGDGGGATGAQLRDPFGVAVYSGGNAFPAGTVFIGDTGDNEVRKVSPDGTITTVAGDGSPCMSPPACGDGGPATSAQLNRPEGVAVDSAGNVYIADSGDNEVRIVGTDGKIGRIAGTGRQCSTRPNCGDDGPATNASLSTPFGIAVDRAGQVFVSDTGDDEARRIDAGGIITRVAGDGRECSTPPNCGDGGPATSAHLTSPLGVAIGPRGQVYIADGADYEVRVVDIGSITGFAGNGTPCTFAPGCGDGGPATGAKVNPAGIAVDPSGNLYITDAANDEVRKVSAGDTTEDRTITRIAGDGTECTSPSSCGDGSPAISAEFNLPYGVAADPAGSVYIADVGDNEVRKVGSPVP